MPTIIAWNDWFRCMAKTYGTWLPGDDRGFRTRHHKEHIEGDYKDPPPKGKYTVRHQHAQNLLKRNPVILCPLACREMAEALLFHNVELIDLSVNSMHVHLLARFPAPPPGSPRIPIRRRQIDPSRDSALDDPPRHYLGIAKKRSAAALSQAGLVAPGGAWAKRGKVIPIRNRAHFDRSRQYIRNHVHEGAAVWSLLQLPDP